MRFLFAVVLGGLSTMACGGTSSSSSAAASGDGGRSEASATLTSDAGSSANGDGDAALSVADPGDASGGDAGTSIGAGDDDDGGSAAQDGGDAGIQAVTVPLVLTGGASMISASFAGGAPANVLFDTGSTGIWVVQSALPSGTPLPTGPTLHAAYGGCLDVSGPSGMLPLTIGSITVNVIMAVATSTSSTGAAGCPSTPPAGKILNGAGVIGVGLRTPANGLVNPLPLMTAHGRWVISLEPIGTPTGTLTLNPGAAAMRFANRTQLTSDGNGGWDDTAVPFCVNSFCKTGLVDSGESSPILLVDGDSDYASIGIPSGSTTVPSGTTLAWTVNSGPAYSFTVSNNPQTGIDLIKVKTSGFSNNLGTVAFRYLDWYFDSVNGIIGAAPKM